MNEPRNRYDLRQQTVYGHQINIAGNVGDGVKIELPPLQPSAAAAPAPPPDFVGRQEQLAQLAATLIAGKSAAITALQGMGGIGKTALAQQLAATLASHFSGGIFWADLALHAGSAETILRAWGAFCGADLSQEPNPVVLSERVRALLAMRREAQGALLAVLDDVRAEWLTTARLLKQSLPAETPLLLTTRDVDLATALDADVVRLDVLPEENAYELLATRVKPQTILTPEATVKALLQQLGYLPLAIRLAAGHVSKLARKPGFALNQFVADVAQRAMSLLDAAGGSGLAATFEISYAALSAEQQRVFRYCSVYSPALLTVEHMAGLLEMDAQVFEAMLDELVDVALLEWDQATKGRYVLHPMLRQYGDELLQKNGDVPSAYRLAAEYLGTIITHPGPGGTAEEILEEIDQWEKAQDWETMVHHASELIEGLARLGYWSEIDQRIIAAQNIVHKLENAPIHTAALWTIRGHIAYKQALWTDAILYYERAQQIFSQIGDLYGLATTWLGLGNTSKAQGEWDKAISYYEQAKQYFEEKENHHGSATVYNGLGLVYQVKGEWEQALYFFEQAHQLYSQEEDNSGLASSYHNLALIYQLKSEWTKAISYYEQAIQLQEQLADIHSLALALANLGTLYGAKGDWESSISVLEQAMQMLEYVGDQHTLARTWMNLGLAYSDKGDQEKVLSYLERSHQIKTHLGDTHGLAQSKVNLGLAYHDKGEWMKAVFYLEQALQTFEQLADVHGLAKTRANLGFVLHMQEKWTEAIAYYEKALQTFKELGDISGLANTSNSLGAIYHTKEMWDKAISYYEQAMQAQEQLGDLRSLAQTWSNMGRLYYSQGLTDQAANYTARAFLKFHELGTAEAQQTANDLVQILGSSEAATEYLKQITSNKPTPEQSVQHKEGITLNQLLDMIFLARQGNHDIGKRVYDMLRELSASPEAPSALRTLANVLTRILVGINDPDLSQLPVELAEAVQGMLNQLKK